MLPFGVSYSFWLSQKVGFLLRTKPAKGTLISYSSSGPFYDRFCTKTDNFDFEVATSDRSILALPSAYQECPVAFKLMTSQAVQRARPLTGHIWPLGRPKVKPATQFRK